MARNALAEKQLIEQPRRLASYEKPFNGYARQWRLNADAFSDPVIHPDHTDFRWNLAPCGAHCTYGAGGNLVITTHDGEWPFYRLQLL